MRLLIVLLFFTGSLVAQERYDYTGLTKTQCQEMGINNYSSPDSSVVLTFEGEKLYAMRYCIHGSIAYFKAATWFYLSGLDECVVNGVHVFYRKPMVEIELYWKQDTNETIVEIIHE